MLPWLSAQPPIGVPFALNRASHQAVGLSAWWPTLGFSGGTRLHERGRNILHGTLTGGPTWVADPIMGAALSLDGTDDYVPCGTVSSPVGTGDAAYSLAVWVRPDAIRNDGMWISYGAAATNEVVSIGSTGSNFYTVHFGNDHDWGIAVTLGSTYHVVVTYDPASSTETLYLNGFAAASWTPTNVNLQASASLYVGRSTWNNTYAQTCRVGDTRIYNRPLSAAEVFQLYAPQTRWQLYQPLVGFGSYQAALAPPASFVAASADNTYIPRRASRVYTPEAQDFTYTPKRQSREYTP
jgi:hypothetical protein